MHRIVIVSDIFGKTQALKKLCKAVISNVDVIDPYAGNYMDFRTEQEAYEFFMNNVGLSTYCDLLLSRLEKVPSPTNLVGFSVGASAIWQVSELLNTNKINRVVCFYGSQVRNLTEIKPNVVVEHLLPIHEPGYSISELASQLSRKENVVIHKTPYLHGFMNKLSKNYNKSGYATYIDWLREMVITHNENRIQSP